MSRYVHAYLQQMVCCADCGAVVQDQAIHDRWHEDGPDRPDVVDATTDPYEAQADAARAEWLAERDES